MARINSYPKDLAIGGSEVLLGSDSDGSTKTFGLTDIRDFMIKNGVANTSVFKAETDSSNFGTGNILISTAAASGLSGVTQYKVSKTNIAGVAVSEYLDDFEIGKHIEMFALPEVGQFQKYRVTSKTNNSDHYLIGVSNLPTGSSSPFTDEKIYGFNLLENDLNFNTSFTSNSSMWSGSGPYTLTIIHNLYKQGTVDIFDSSGTKVIGSVQNNNLTYIQVVFTSKFSGTAFVN